MVTVEKSGYSTIQDYPARVGADRWRVGIPPSGPMVCDETGRCLFA